MGSCKWHWQWQRSELANQHRDIMEALASCTRRSSFPGDALTALSCHGRHLSAKEAALSCLQADADGALQILRKLMVSRQGMQGRCPGRVGQSIPRRARCSPTGFSHPPALCLPSAGFAQRKGVQCATGSNPQRQGTPLRSCLAVRHRTMQHTVPAMPCLLGCQLAACCCSPRAGDCLPDSTVHGPGAGLRLRHWWGHQAAWATFGWQTTPSFFRSQGCVPVPAASRRCHSQLPRAHCAGLIPRCSPLLPTGFLIRRLPSSGGPWQPSWSAPSYYRCHGLCIGVLAGDSAPLQLDSAQPGWAPGAALRRRSPGRPPCP